MEDTTALTEIPNTISTFPLIPPIFLLLAKVKQIPLFLPFSQGKEYQQLLGLLACVVSEFEDRHSEKKTGRSLAFFQQG